ncbi:MAG: hypothetical protein ACT4PM_00800 [Gemmatimonadales bacterium]
MTSPSGGFESGPSRPPTLRQIAGVLVVLAIGIGVPLLLEPRIPRQFERAIPYLTGLVAWTWVGYRVIRWLLGMTRTPET